MRRRSSTAPRVGVGVWAIIVVVMVSSLIPFYWLINTSLKFGPGLSTADLWPRDPSFQNYVDVLNDGRFLTAVGNSVIVASVTTLLALLFGSSAAYALARLPLPRKAVMLTLVSAVTTFPVITIIAPIFEIWTQIGLYDTLIGLIIPKLTFSLPLAIFTLTSFFREIPSELEEAAAIDGCGPITTFVRVILPLATPGLAATAILVFISAWNEFLLAVALTSTPAAQTVPVAIAYFTGVNQFEIPLGTIAAASVIVTIPLLAVVLVFQRRIVAGLTSGAVKG